jgi:hypothetical protein
VPFLGHCKAPLTVASTTARHQQVSITIETARALRRNPAISSVRFPSGERVSAAALPVERNVSRRNAMKTLATFIAVVALALAVLLIPSARAQGSIFPSKQQRALARHLDPATVSAEARVFLKGKMKAHGKDLRELSMAVATLNFAEAKHFAQGIANQPRLDPSVRGGDVLPADYFVLQDGLKQLAGELVSIAETRDAQELVSAYAHLVQTCAGCHHAFIEKQAEKPGARKPSSR